MARHRMRNADAAWLHMDRPENLMVINAVMWFERPLALERLEAVCRTRLVDPFPRFRQRVLEPRVGPPQWEDVPEVRVRDHLHHVALPAPGDRTALEDLVSDLITVPLDRSRPLWHFHLIDGYGEGSAVLARMHHCIADGIALARVLLSLTDGGPTTGIAPLVAAQAAGRAAEGVLRRALAPVTRPASAALGITRRASAALVHEGTVVARHPSELLRLAREADRDARSVARVTLRTPDPHTVLKRDLGVVKRVAWSEGLPLDRVRAIAHATGTTINDVLLAAVAGALRDELRRHGDEVAQIRAIVPFNIRPLDEPLPRDLGNEFGLVYLPLPVGARTARQRLAAVAEGMAAIKDSPDAAVSYGILALMGTTPTRVEQVLLDAFTALGSAVVTNVPGPREPVSLAGVPARGVLVWAPTSGSVAMSVSIFSYAGEVSVGFYVDAASIPQPGRIVKAFGRDLDRLERLAPVA